MEEGQGFCNARSGVQSFLLYVHASESLSEGYWKGRKRGPGYDLAGRFNRISGVQTKSRRLGV